jgi:hypothetical protein
MFTCLQLATHSDNRLEGKQNKKIHLQRDHFELLYKLASLYTKSVIFISLPSHLFQTTIL